MRILLKFELDCEPDAAWTALRSPAVFRSVARPFTTFKPIDPPKFPDVWGDKPMRVSVRALGFIPIGEQVIDISTRTLPRPGKGDVRLVRDTGGGLTGPLALVTSWQHTMAVSPAPDGRTLYRDQLNFGAGILGPLFWPVYWAFWQWRASKIRSRSKRWRA